MVSVELLSSQHFERILIIFQTVGKKVVGHTEIFFKEKVSF